MKNKKNIETYKKCNKKCNQSNPETFYIIRQRCLHFFNIVSKRVLNFLKLVFLGFEKYFTFLFLQKMVFYFF